MIVTGCGVLGKRFDGKRALACTRWVRGSKVDGDEDGEG